jgi:hypothetical protein
MKEARFGPARATSQKPNHYLNAKKDGQDGQSPFTLSDTLQTFSHPWPWGKRNVSVRVTLFDYQFEKSDQ